MLGEALVIFSCLKSVGCSETSSTYFYTYPDMKEFVDKKAKNVEEFVGPKFIHTFGPMIYAVAGGTGTLKLNKYISLQASREKGTLMFSKEF